MGLGCGEAFDIAGFFDAEVLGGLSAVVFDRTIFLAINLFFVEEAAGRDGFGVGVADRSFFDRVELVLP